MEARHLALYEGDRVGEAATHRRLARGASAIGRQSQVIC